MITLLKELLHQFIIFELKKSYIIVISVTLVALLLFLVIHCLVKLKFNSSEKWLINELKVGIILNISKMYLKFCFFPELLERS